MSAVKPPLDLKSLLPLRVRDAIRPWKKPGHGLAKAMVKAATRGRVASGPFAGMVFGLEQPDLPKILGTYEKELHGVILGLRGVDPHKVINVGGGEGYYAVGFALMLPRAEIIVFEMDPVRRALLSELIRLNGVESRISQFGVCDNGSLRKSIKRGARNLVVMDVEGAERSLLDPVDIPELRWSWIIVECHDGRIPDISRQLRERFSSSHDCQDYSTAPRVLTDFPLPGRRFQAVSKAALCATMDEQRPWPQEWLYFSPRAMVE